MTTCAAIESNYQREWVGFDMLAVGDLTGGAGGSPARIALTVNREPSRKA